MTIRSVLILLAIAVLLAPMALLGLGADPQDELTVHTLHVQKIVMKSGKYSCEISVNESGVFVEGKALKPGPGFTLSLFEGKEGPETMLTLTTAFKGNTRKPGPEAHDLALYLRKDYEPRLQVNDGQTVRSYCLGHVADLLDTMGRWFK